MSLEKKSAKSGGGIVRQALVLLFAGLVAVGLAWVFAASLRSVIHARSADAILLEGFELFVAMLFLGTIGFVLIGLLLQLLLPGEYGTRPFANARLHEIYDEWNLRHFSIETEREHMHNAYGELPEIELCDVADQLDREAYPDTWTDLAHEIKNRIESAEPVRIG